MAGLATGKGLTIASTVLSSAGQLYRGIAAKRSAEDEAEQLRAKATARRAEAGSAARDERRQAELARSRALALAAAGGGSVDDPTIVNLMGDLEAEGEYRALSRMYEGEEEARGLEQAASYREREGRSALFGSTLGAVSSVMQGVETLRTKYGGGQRASSLKKVSLPASAQRMPV